MKKVYIIAILAALLAGAATYGFAGYLTNKAVESEVTLRDVYVAIADIPAGTTITEDNAGRYIEAREVREEDIDPNAVTKLSEIANRRLTQDLYAGEQLNINRFDDQAGLFPVLSVDLEKGEVAYSIAAEAVKGVDGYIKPGDTVNIMTNVDGAVKVAFEDLEVLRVATNLDVQTAETDPEGTGEVNTYVSLTVRTTEEQALELYEMEAKTEGNFKFTLNPHNVIEKE